MLHRAAPPDSPQSSVRPLPGWARPKTQSYQEFDAAFLAGANLAGLDAVIRDNPAWAGVWRQRLALQAAVASLRLIGRREEQSQLRDAELLRRPGDDPGPGGRVLLSWRQLVARASSFSSDAIARAGASFGLAVSAAECEMLAGQVSDAVRSDRAAIVAAAELAEQVVRLRLDAELLALWLADAVLAHKFKWPVPVPLLVTALLDAELRIGPGGRRPRPGGAGWQQAVALAYAKAAESALGSAGELSRRAETLQAIMPKLRAKGAGMVVVSLLNEDALVASAGIGGLSDRGSRRLFDRLVALGAVRELSGRSTFRIYGL